MVKADYKRDYYADLEVSSTADTETIKKKFRELGTYHGGKMYRPASRLIVYSQTIPP